MYKQIIREHQQNQKKKKNKCKRKLFVSGSAVLSAILRYSHYGDTVIHRILNNHYNFYIWSRTTENHPWESGTRFSVELFQTPETEGEQKRKLRARKSQPPLRTLTCNSAVEDSNGYSLFKKSSKNRSMKENKMERNVLLVLINLQLLEVWSFNNKCRVLGGWLENSDGFIIEDRLLKLQKKLQKERSYH